MGKDGLQSETFPFLSLFPAYAGKRDKKGKVSDCNPSFPIQIIHEH